MEGEGAEGPKEQAELAEGSPTSNPRPDRQRACAVKPQTHKQYRLIHSVLSHKVVAVATKLSVER